MENHGEDDMDHAECFVEHAERNDFVASDDTEITEDGSMGEEDSRLESGDESLDGDFLANEDSVFPFSVPVPNAATALASTGTASEERSAGPVSSYYLDDVICGRGKEPNNHFGNQNFRRLIRENCEAYQALKRNASKTRFVEALVDRVKLTGRFLEKNKDGEGFFEMSDADAKRKVGQVSGRK